MLIVVAVKLKSLSSFLRMTLLRFLIFNYLDNLLRDSDRDIFIKIKWPFRIIIKTIHFHFCLNTLDQKSFQYSHLASVVTFSLL